jgi:hypothetical protein
MSIRGWTAALAIAGLVAANGCAAGVAALLLYQLLDDEAPVRTFTGTVRDASADPVGGVLVQMKAEVAGDDDVLHFSDTTTLDSASRSSSAGTGTSVTSA